MKHFKHLIVMVGAGRALFVRAGRALFVRAGRALPLLLAIALLPMAAQAQNIANGNINISGGSTTINGTSSTYRVTVTGGTSNITLQGVNITGGTGDDQAPITVKNGATVTITLTGDNTLTAQGINAGLRVEPGATVTITSASGGKLTANGGGNSRDGGAGIGGMGLSAATRVGSGTITITGNAEVTATGGGEVGAGIGGGCVWNNMGNGEAYTGSITISGSAIVNATGVYWGAGIGSGALSNNNGTITISGGTVTANGGLFGAAGIGGGYSGGGGTININGGVVIATGNYGACGLGSGSYGASTTAINISGGAVFANSICREDGITGGMVVVNDELKFDSNLTTNITIPNGKTLIIPNGKTLTVANGVTLTNNGTITPANGSTVTVNGTVSGTKINGANSPAPSLNTKNHNSITLNSVTLLAATGQEVEYGISTTNNSANVSTWQTARTFSGLSANTTYYFFARAKGNANFKEGAASASSGAIKTDGTPVTLSAVANGEANRATSTTLTLTFGDPVTGLTADKIALTTDAGGAATKGTLSGSGTTYTLAITNVTQGTVTVTVANLDNFTVSPVSGVAVYEDKRTVTGVGTQTGTLTYGTAGSVTYTGIAMTHFADMSATAVTLAGAPAGVSGTVAVTGGGGTLTLTTLATTPAGNHGSITFTVDGKTSNTFTLTVDKKPLTVTGIAFQDKDYDGTTDVTPSGTPSLSGIVNTDDVTPVSSAVSYAFASAAAGTTTVNRSGNYSLGGTKAANYALTQPSTSFSATISKATPTRDDLTFNIPTSHVYNTSPQGIGSVAVKSPKTGMGTITVYYTGTDNTDGKTATPPTSAGTYAVTADVAADGSNFTAASGIALGTYTISKATEPQINYPTAATITYGQTLSASILSGGDTQYGDFAWTSPTTVPTVTNTGYSVTFTPSDATVRNYETITQTTQNVTLTVNPKTLTISGSITATKVYDSNANFDHTHINIGAANLVGVVAGDESDVSIDKTAATATLLSANVVSNTTVTGAGFALGGTKAGNYALSAQPTVTANITQATLTITPDAGKNKVYGAADPTLTYASTGWKGSDESIKNSLLTGALTRATGEDVNTYAILAGNVSAGGNYAIDFVTTKTFAITKATLTVTPDDSQSKVYGAGDPAAYTYITSGWQFSDEDDKETLLTGALSRVTGSDAGNYNIEQGSLSETGGNYNINFVAGKTFAITPATLTVTPDDSQSKVYGAGDPAAYTYETSGWQYSDEASKASLLTGALTRATGEDVNTYAIQAGNLLAGGNYTIDLAAKTFAITKATLTVTPDDNQSKAYGDPDPTLTCRAAGWQRSDDETLFTGALARAAGEDVDTYEIEAGDLSAGGNYEISFTTGKTFEITQATAPTINYPTATPVTYGQALSASSLTGGDTQYGTFEWTAPATVPTVANSGYEVTFTPSPATIRNYQTITQTTDNVLLTVNRKDLAAAGVQIAGTYIYNSTPQTPAASSVTVTLAGFGTLTDGTDYTYAVTGGGTDVGAATVTVTGQGNFTGAATGTFEIHPNIKNGIVISGDTVSMPATGQFLFTFPEKMDTATLRTVTLRNSWDGTTAELTGYFLNDSVTFVVDYRRLDFRTAYTLVLSGFYDKAKLYIYEETFAFVTQNFPPPPAIARYITLPALSGVVMQPAAGSHRIQSGSDFTFTLAPPAGMVPHVSTDRNLGGAPETLKGTPNADGSYTFVIRDVRENITVSITFATGNEAVGAASLKVWPNPVPRGGTARLEYGAPDNTEVRIYTMQGTLVSIQKLQNGQAVLTFPPVAGVYVVRVGSATVKATLK